VDKEQLDSYLLAGKINSQALDLGTRMIKPGVSVVEVLDKVEEFIKSKNATPAFPAQISINNVAAHFCPINDELKLAEGDVVKLDVGVSINGYIADAARTVDLGNNKEIVLASQLALKNALAIVRPGIDVGEIGRVIQETISSFELTPIKNLSGHGLARYKIHAEPHIPNIKGTTRTELKEDQVIAIEPFATNGAGMVYESGTPTVFSFISEKPLRNPTSRKIVQELKQFDGMPFASRWLIPKYGVASTQLALREMVQLGIVHPHPPLLEKGKGIVSQAEHSVIVKDKPIIFTKYEE
jgi:methionyl aminopeptidase